MSLGDAEVKINHDYFFDGFCPQCKKRGINNRTELHTLGNIICCGSCKSFLKGELDRDVPELKLYMRNMGTESIAPAQQPESPISVKAPITYSEDRSTSSDIDVETAEYAEWLAKNSDTNLRQEIFECMMTDKDSLYSILTSRKYFSLKELKKHAERLNKPTHEQILSDSEFEKRALKSKISQARIKTPKSKDIRQQRKRAREYMRKYRKKKKEPSCRSRKNQDTSKSTTTLSSITTEASLPGVETTLLPRQERQERGNVQVMQKQVRQNAVLKENQDHKPIRSRS